MKQYDKTKMDECLNTIDFPADKQLIIDQAKDGGADNQELRVLERIEEKDYASKGEVLSSIEKMAHPSQHNNQRQKADAMA